LYAALVVAHGWLLRLPYFWDEAGYYIPAANDFFTTGKLIPFSTLTNAHPPLPSMYLALWWKVFGYSPLVTRLAMLLVASFGLWQIFLIARKVANRDVAVATTWCCGLYPVFFAQSSLAHADLPAMAFTLLGLRLYLEDRRWQCAIAFAVAALSKETAFLTPAVLLAWELCWLSFRLLVAFRGYDVHFHSDGESFLPWMKPAVRCRDAFKLSIPALALAAWYAYHYSKTGFVFGNPEFVRYNVATTLSPLRFALALWQRTWQVFGHMNMWVLSAMSGAAMLLPPIVERAKSARPGGNWASLRTGSVPDEPETFDEHGKGDGARPRIAISTQLLFLTLIAVHIVAYSLIGGALLSRYLMPVTPLVIIIGISTLWRRVREWKWLVGFVCLAYVVGWFVNPPYRFAPEDNLNYADFVTLHQHAIKFAGTRYERVLTSWPASDEIRKPLLGFVDKPPMAVVTIENFSFDQIILAQQHADYDAVLAFSTKYEPQGRFLRWEWWEKQNARFFDYHRDLPPEVIASLLGGSVVMQESKNGQWVAVIEMPRTRNAVLR
jgi:hypothetical protein